MSGGPDDRDRRVEDYMRGRTDEHETRDFEIEMLEDDELFSRVQSEELLRRGLRETELGNDDYRRRWWQARWPAWALTGALAAVTAVLGVNIFMLNERIHELQSPVSGVPVITLLEQRSLLSDSKSTGLAGLEGRSGPVLIEIDVSGYQQEFFGLQLSAHDGDRLWTDQRPDGRGYLTLQVPDAGTLLAIRILSPEGEVLKTYRQQREE